MPASSSPFAQQPKPPMVLSQYIDEQTGFAVSLTMKNNGLIHQGTLLPAFCHAPVMS